MVDRTAGQLYTIEGFAAAMILVVTAWIVVGTTSIYTPGDSHITDMQLEQLGTDILVMMDTPDNATYNFATGSNYPWGKSVLQKYIENQDGNGPILFNNMFLNYCNNKTDQGVDNLQYSAWVYYRKVNETKSYEFNKSRALSAGDHAVRVTHWVQVDNRLPHPIPPMGMSTDMESRVQAVLMEVLLWKG
jgi:hypothetical protein